jgi:hypothetical protein
MKTLTIAALAAAIPAVALTALPGAASAQTATGVYAGLGYADTDVDHVNLGSIQGRLGYRFNNWLGVEGELAGGVKNDTVTVGGIDTKVKLQSQEAAYAVGFAPLGPNTDLIGRIGYGHTDAKAAALGTTRIGDGDSWNFGVGAQHYFDGVNGVRVDYTREEYQGSGSDHANVWALGYTRRF